MKTFMLIVITILIYNIDAKTQSPEQKISEQKEIRTIKVGRKKNPNVFTIVQEMPMFPDSACLLLGNRNTQKVCADQKWQEYINQTVQYPDSAREGAITGTVVMSFTVEADGQISTVEILRDPGGGLGEEGFRVINQMIADKGPWVPGRQKGVAVATRMNLPIRFKIR